jgi:hypothetical protein
MKNESGSVEYYLNSYLKMPSSSVLMSPISDMIPYPPSNGNSISKLWNLK